MSPPLGPPLGPPLSTWSASDYLLGLLADTQSVAERLAAADAAARRTQAAAARRESARLSARLDASPLTDATADSVDEREARGCPPVDLPADGRSPAARVITGWAQTLKVDDVATQEVAAREYANLLACFDAEAAVTAEFLEHPREVLATLHAVICRGLVEPAAAGRPRTTEQAVHDGAQGRVLYRAAPPDRVESLLGGLAAWLTGPAAAEPALVVAGVVHERILRWQPFEVANGRVARAVARVVLRARGVDPEGLAVAERLLAADPLAYHRQIAANLHRRGLGPWLELTTEAVLSGLVAAAAAVDPGGHPPPPPRATAVTAGLEPGTELTLVEYAELVGVDLVTARNDLRVLVVAGSMGAVPGAGGLRVRRVLTALA